MSDVKTVSEQIEHLVNAFHNYRGTERFFISGRICRIGPKLWRVVNISDDEFSDPELKKLAKQVRELGMCNLAAGAAMSGYGYDLLIKGLKLLSEAVKQNINETMQGRNRFIETDQLAEPKERRSQ